MYKKNIDPGNMDNSKIPPVQVNNLCKLCFNTTVYYFLKYHILHGKALEAVITPSYVWCKYIQGKI